MMLQGVALAVLSRSGITLDRTAQEWFVREFEKQMRLAELGMLKQCRLVVDRETQACRAQNNTAGVKALRTAYGAMQGLG